MVSFNIFVKEEIYSKVIAQSYVDTSADNYIYFGLDLHFKNAVVAIEDKQEDLFINMLEVTLRSRNEVLKQSLLTYSRGM